VHVTAEDGTTVRVYKLTEEEVLKVLKIEGRAEGLSGANRFSAHVRRNSDARTVKMTNTMGQTIADLPIINHTIDISAQPPGIYVLRLIDGGRTRVRKIVKR
jgi:hypothetical protein